MTLTTELAARIAGMSGRDLSDQALANAKTVILDTVGCMLAGAREPVVDVLLRTAGLNTAGPVSLPGRTELLDPLCAALVGGAAAHALDFDDVNIAMGGHPSAPILAALLPLAELHPCSGRDFLLAFVSGFETETRLARSVNFHHYDKGWHPTATLGVFGAAAACAKLLRLPAEQIAVALALSVSLASGVKANFGTMTKPFHVGHCARHGLMAALLAQQGFTANLEAFEHKQGFFNVFNGPGTFEVDRAISGWAAPLDIVKPGIGIKLYPCCDSTHPSLDALFTLQKQYGFTADDVSAIETRIHPLRLTHINRPQPKSELDAKFSVQFCIARALLDGRIVLNSFGEQAYADPKAQDLMSRVDARALTDLENIPEGNYLTELTVTTRDGHVLKQRMERPYGRRADEPAPAELIRAKYDHCAVLSLPASAATALHDILMTLETLDEVGTLTHLWTT